MPAVLDRTIAPPPKLREQRPYKGEDGEAGRAVDNHMAEMRWWNPDAKRQATTAAGERATGL
jgi:hypothetical protein